MKDETVDTGSQPFDDFDLDSFLRENNFLSDEDKKDAEAAVKQPDKRSGRRAASRPPASDKADETSKIDATNKTGKTGGIGSRAASARVKADESAARAASARVKAEEDGAAAGAAATNATAGTARSGRVGRASRFDAGDNSPATTEGVARNAPTAASTRDGASTRAGVASSNSADTASTSTREGAVASTRDTPSTSNKASTHDVAAATTPRTRRAKKTDAVDLNATMSYQALGEDYPEIPLVGVGEGEDDTKSASGKATRRSRSSAGSVAAPGAGVIRDSDLDAFDAAVAAASEATAESSRKTRSTAGGSANDVALGGASVTKASVAGVATAGALAAGAATAEAPLAGASAVGASATVGAAVDASPTSRRRLTAASATSAVPAGAVPSASVTPASVTPASAISTTSASAAPASAAPRSTQAANSGSSGRNGTASQRGSRSNGFTEPLGFQEAYFAESGYHIRGGGTRHNRRSPLMIILMAVVIITGGGLLAYGLLSAFDELLVEKPPEVVVTLTANETRAAIDVEMPRMFDYINGDAAAAHATLAEAGQNVVLDDTTSSIPIIDGTAIGNKVIHLSPSVDAAILDEGYRAGGLNAYDFNGLQRSFNGAWVLDILRGDRGPFIQLDYVNFASVSLDNELQHLRERQELAGENSAVDSQDSDDYGNSYIRGYTVIDDTRYFWEVIGIPFSEFYSGQDRRKLPDTAVFVRCRIATYDFYGAGNLPSDDEPPADGNEGEGGE